MKPRVPSLLAKACCVLLWLCLQIQVAVAQQSSVPAGGVRGVVVDPTGAVVADAQVELKRADTATRLATTDARGTFRFEGLDTGEYELTVHKDGFKSTTRTLEMNTPAAGVVEIALQPAVMNYAVTVTATRAEKPLFEVPAAVGVVGKDDIQLARPQVGLDEALTRIPGLFMQNRYNFSSDLRVSIRGFGSRTPFGIRGIKLMMDGIPETLPDGQGEVDAMDLGSADRVEVIRGPASSLFGNASGGVINVISESGSATPSVDARVAAGAFGSQKYQVKARGQARRLNYLVSLSRLELDGHRGHSRTENVLLNGKVGVALTGRETLTFVATFVDSPEADNPGALTLAQANADPRQANTQNVLFNAGEEVRQARIGAVYRRSLRADDELVLTGYYMNRDLSNRGGFHDEGIVLRDRYFVGGGAKYINHGSLFGNRNRLTAGIDIEYQHDDRQRYHNELGQFGALTFDQIETVGSVGPFIQDELMLHDRLELTVGARYDRLPFKVGDHFLADRDDSGERILSEFSPKLGLRYAVRANLSVYGNIATSFETPTTTEFTNPLGGGFNPDIEPQTAVNYEVGVKRAGASLGYELAVFRIRVKDELIPFELPQTPGRDYFRNAGASVRNGVETAATVRPVAGLSVSAAYTYSDFTFETFSAGGAVFDGRHIPGIPRHTAFGEIAYVDPHSGVFGMWESIYQGSLFANNANTVTVRAQVVSNLRLGVSARLHTWQIAPFVGINNILNERFNSNVNINAFGGRYFEPGPSRNAYAGITVGYAFRGRNRDTTR